MIITKIVGGLGNQMFQYAIGRRLALDTGDRLVLDLMDFETYRRPYFLDRFTIAGDTLPVSDARAYRRFEGRRSIPLFLEQLKPIARRSYRLEAERDYFKYVRAYLSPPTRGTVYLNGYWQHQDYFSPIRKTLLEDFRLKPEFDLTQNPLVQEILATESVSLHFRRGEDQVNKFYGACPPAYYERCLDELAKRLPDAALRIYVFSNDIEWVKQNFTSRFPTTFVTPSHGLTDFQELVAMSLCKHNVIANSTFSWWAAWLNDNPGRHVFAPWPWLINEERYDCNELLPKEWIRIASKG